jgi:molybdenum cofactor biosynthesis protein B
MFPNFDRSVLAPKIATVGWDIGFFSERDGVGRFTMSNSVTQHKADSPTSIACGVITVSDTRTLETDRGGSLVIELLESTGHRVAAREIIPDEPVAITEAIDRLIAESVPAILMTGGTGISSRDQTYETVTGMFTKHLPGYGELFRMLSYEEIGAAAMLSRATGGVIRRSVLLTMPGSPPAVRLAMERLILPELPHLVQQALK